MVVVEQPEEGDRESLLSGPMGQLLGGILAASGIARDEIYLATALPRHAPLTDWETAQTRILGEVLRHHIGLVAPRRVLLLSSRIPSLLGNDPAQKAASIEQITLGESAVAAMATRDLEGLLNRPRWRAEFWRKWLEWTQEDRKREAL